MNRRLHLLRIFLLSAALAIHAAASAISCAATIDVYIAAGQSNMDGRGLVAELNGELEVWNAAQPSVLIHYTRPADTSTVGIPQLQSDWAPLAPGFSAGPGSGDALPGLHFGPELTFGHAMAEHFRDRHIAILKIARGGTSMADHWNFEPGSVGDMAAAFRQTIPSALQSLRDRGDEVRIRGMIWHQGESDTTSTPEEFGAALTNLITQFRSELGANDLPFVIGELSQSMRLYNRLRATQLAVSESMSQVGFASSTDLLPGPNDLIHFSTSSQLELGFRYAAAMQTLLVPEPHAALLVASCSLACAPRRRRFSCPRRNPRRR
ncbi:MAG: hypothetical protein KDA61_03120 [Planctomycetales bacterium]|nr:hypothetical protein [Planctomycetales bacterium]